MSQRLWLLVEWIDEDNVFPCYGIVHIDRFAYRGSDISMGKEILLRVKVNEPRRAKIVRVAGAYHVKIKVSEYFSIFSQRDFDYCNCLCSFQIISRM